MLFVLIILLLINFSCAEEKQDGKWKFVLDTGTQGLPDKKE
jgi:hypothetical protein